MKKYFILLFITILFTGCLKQNNYERVDLKLDNTYSIIKGKISKNELSNKDIYVILFKYIGGDMTKDSSYKIVDFSSNSNRLNSFEFNVNNGTYLIYACQSLAILQEKRYAYEFYSDILKVENKSIKNVNIKFDKKPKLSTDNILIATKNEDSIFEESNKIKTTSLDNMIFKRENSKIGMWDPLNFYKDVGGGLYLLGEYKKDKKVVLFVHGMAGTPWDFKTIINSLDKEKYFPMVYFYPTGINLNYAVDNIAYLIDNLTKEYKIENMSIIAHSMGGLVAKAFVDKYKNRELFDDFITIATPWNGQKYAKLGGDMAKRIAPSFGNMIPNSVFLQNLQNTRLPKDLNHHLFFAFKGKTSLVLDSSNDGVISLSSQLYDKIQKNAYEIYGFNNTHTSILKSHDLSRRIKYILDN